MEPQNEVTVKQMIAVLLSPLKGQTPCNYTNIIGKSHRKQHLGSEHARIPYLHPLPEAFMITGIWKIIDINISAKFGKFAKHR